MKRSPRRRFAYQLALKLGYVNVDAMCRSITAKQLIEWEAYARLEPFGEVRDDYRFASVVAMIFNMAVVAKDRKPIDTFLLKWEDGEEQPKKKKQTWQEQFEIAKQWAMAYSVKGQDT